MTRLKAIVQRALELLGLRLVTIERVTTLEKTVDRLAEVLRIKEAAERIILSAVGETQQSLLLSLSSQAQSQLGQDLFAAFANGMKREGFFVEIGAGDGVVLSNTLLLEKFLGWTGLLSEPLPEHHDSIRENRLASLDTACVWSQTGAHLELVQNGYLSTIEAFRSSDIHAAAREGKPTQTVSTVSLLDLLRRNNAPQLIDFMSIDTEGSELEILSAYPFNQEFQISVIACEHNFSANRDLLANLLTKNGYRRVAGDVSEHDDWFVLDTPEMQAFWPSLLEVPA